MSGELYVKLYFFAVEFVAMGMQRTWCLWPRIVWARRRRAIAACGGIVGGIGWKEYAVDLRVAMVFSVSFAVKKMLGCVLEGGHACLWAARLLVCRREGIDLRTSGREAAMKVKY